MVVGKSYNSAIDDRAVQNQLLSLQNRILEDMVKGVVDFQRLLDRLCLCAEELAPGAVATIMLLDSGHNRLFVEAGPSASAQLIKDLSGLTPSSNTGSCSNAVFTGQPTYVANTHVESEWSKVRSIANRYQIDACWSHPVLSSGKVVGSFALSNSEPSSPNEFQKNLLAVCANMVALILQQRKQQDALWAAAHHDALTGLPNRLLLDKHLQHAIRNADRTGKRLAVLFIDMDNFKDINDSYGHDFGDQVLLAVTTRIRQVLRQGDIVARHGGDEFILLLENFADKLDINNIAKKILLSFQAPLDIQGKTITSRFSIGISVYPDDATDSHGLLQNADIAMYQAKTQGKNSIQYFEQKLADRIYGKVRMEQRLRDALMHHELELYYQPQYRGDSDTIDSMEALLRWNHPVKGQLLPADFLPVAEQSQLIAEISLYVFDQACRQIRRWLDLGLQVPRVSINFPSSMLKENFVNELANLLEATGCPGNCLEIEITELLVMSQGVKGIEELQKIGSLGMFIALDDFGTGFSSLTHMKSLPVTKLKIDQSFIEHIDDNDKDRHIIDAIISMGKSLNMQIVAEGVETASQQYYLLQHGCDIIQGYFRHAPVSSGDIQALLKPA